MESIDDEDDQPVNKNIAPHNKSHVLELANGDDDDDLPARILVDVPAKKVSYKYLFEKKYLFTYLKRTALAIRPSPIMTTQRHLRMRRTLS